MMEKAMLSVMDEVVISGPTISCPSSAAWFYLSFEFLAGLAISGFLIFLGVVKSFLPKPPRDLTGDVVLVTGASSSLGSLLAEEFARGGCSVICVDEPGSSVDAVASTLRAKYPGVERIGSRYHRKQHDDDDATGGATPSSIAYNCNLWDREQIKTLAKRMKEDVGRLDILITCAGSPDEAVFDTVSRTLMSHYWTVLAFLPAMLHRERAHVIGITPTVSTEDAYMGSKAAIAGLMESLGQQFSGRNNRLTFMTVAPRAEPSLLRQNEREIAKEVVRAVQRDSSYLSMTWSSNLLYNVSCKLYNGITTVTRWLNT
ncbi:retinol dehydrogenase 10-B-like [Phymastichus coffea]|uniref:retinol dehydrogenase 10-B-like n=1 Tax=Phymastichus coffea TaxID=108790 RepID=UPI00273BC911|nr:retinol dehydrogenase 10-B-like [Phymastichus coffea]